MGWIIFQNFFIYDNDQDSGKKKPSSIHWYFPDHLKYLKFFLTFLSLNFWLELFEFPACFPGFPWSVVNLIIWKILHWIVTIWCTVQFCASYDKPSKKNFFMREISEFIHVISQHWANKKKINFLITRIISKNKNRNFNKL